MAGNILFFAILTIFVVGIIVGIVRSCVLANRYEEVVREWAREQGYAVITIEREGRIFDYLLWLFFDAAGLIPGLFLKVGRYGFRVLIEDEQGDLAHVMVFVRGSGKPVDVRWDYYPPLL